MIEFIIFIGCFILLLFTHELGHFLSAKILGLTVSKVGISLVPIFHPYVEVENVPNRSAKLFFLFSGPLMTLVLFFICLYFGILTYLPLFYAFVFLLIIEYNPYHSDFTISMDIAPTLSYRERGYFWYSYLLVWISFAAFIAYPGGLLQFVNKFRCI